MHGYSTDSKERRLVPILLAILAIAFAWIFARLLAFCHLSFPWWFDAPSSLGFYAGLYALFDKYLWRKRLVRKMGLSGTPILAGLWYGFLTSSFDTHAKRHDVLVEIFQSWTQISILLRTMTSVSASRVAAMETSGSEGVPVIYEYENQPLPDAPKTMHIHYGTAMLRFSNDDNFTGEYHAGRDRQTFGRIACWKVNRSRPATRAARASVSRKVLIVEDDSAIRNVLTVLLATLGWEGDMARNNRRALNLIRKDDFDAVLLDLRCSESPPEQAASQISKLRPCLIGRVLVITGDVADPSVMKTIERSCLPQVQRRHLLDGLLTALRSLVLNHSKRGANH